METAMAVSSEILKVPAGTTAAEVTAVLSSLSLVRFSQGDWAKACTAQRVENRTTGEIVRSIPIFRETVNAHLLKLLRGLKRMVEGKAGGLFRTASQDYPPKTKSRTRTSKQIAPAGWN